MHSFRTTHAWRAYHWQRAIVAFAAALVAVAATASTALAAPTSDPFALSLSSGSGGLGGGYPINGVEPVTGTVFNLDVTASATWSGTVNGVVGWESTDVRQGADLAVSRLAPLTSGEVDVTWSLSGTVSPLGLGAIAVGPIGLSKDDVPCAPKLSGAGYSCTATSDGLTLIKTPGIPLSPYVNLVLKATFDVTPAGVATTRSLTIGGAPTGPPAALSLTDSLQSETFSISCTAAVGSSVAYALGSPSWTPGLSVSQRPAFQIGLMDPIFGLGELPPLFDAPFGPSIVTAPSFALTGAGHTAELGALLANNVPPTVAPFEAFAGVEGTAISFSVITTSQCPISSYVWQFSNGTTSFGPSPQRVFGDDGLLDGQLTVTDETGLHATRSFTVDVANVDPVTNAGPDDTTDWGRPVAFNGQATDPGVGDQSTLEYSWDFGDGTPSASGGPSTTHSYASPGVYAATLTVSDKDGGTSFDTREIIVTKRDTTTSYTGDLSGTYDTGSTLAASLVDEYGQAVSGRSVSFVVGGGAPLVALTGAGGTATRSFTPLLDAGSYAGSASFAGDGLYIDSVSAGFSYTVVRKATTTLYTGAVSGGPNKTVTLSATLKDATGTPLAGRTIAFALGTQSAAAVTNASGVATTTLKLGQKNGTYTVSATFTPAGADIARYLGSSQAATFKLQAK